MRWLRDLTNSGPEATVGGVAFECRPLRLLACFSWAAPVAWTAALIEASTSGASNLENSFFYRHLMIPVWMVLACHGAYYVHLLAKRFQPGLMVFILAVIAWGNATAWSWAYAGTEFGVTVALGGAVYLAYVLTWCGSVIRLLQLRHILGRVVIAALGLATPPAACGLVLLSWVWTVVRVREYGLFAFPATCVVLWFLCCALLLAAAIVSWQARKAARRLLASSATA